MPVSNRLLFYSVSIPPQLMMTAVGLLPLLILAVRFILERPDRLYRWACLVLTVLLVAWTTYFTQLIPYTSIFVFLWFVFVDPRKRLRDWAIILGVGVVVPLLRAQEFHALFTVAPLSHFRLLRTVAESSALAHRLRERFSSISAFRQSRLESSNRPTRRCLSSTISARQGR